MVFTLLMLKGTSEIPGGEMYFSIIRTKVAKPGTNSCSSSFITDEMVVSWQKRWYAGRNA